MDKKPLDPQGDGMEVEEGEFDVKERYPEE